MLRQLDLTSYHTPPYTYRWCIMECFTFILMGGTTEQIEVLLLAQEGDGESAMQEELIDTFRHFDASKATCFLQEDTDRLLGTIEGRSVERYST